jgi:hypothetical protein
MGLMTRNANPIPETIKPVANEIFFLKYFGTMSKLAVNVNATPTANMTL